MNAIKMFDIAVQPFSVIKGLLPGQKLVKNQEHITGKSYGTILRTQETLFLRKMITECRSWCSFFSACLLAAQEGSLDGR